MIHLSEDITASKLIRDRASLMWTRKIRSTPTKVEYRVVPYSERFDHKSKSKRRVIIDLEADTATCLDYHTGEECPANSDSVPNTGAEKMPRLCSHVWATLTTLHKYGRKAQKEIAA